VTPSAACGRCSSVVELEQTRVLRPDARLCDKCWCELDSGLSRRPRRERRLAAATRARHCADCGRRPSRGLPLGGVYDADGARRTVCFTCYLKQRAPRRIERVERHELEPLTSDQIFDRAADLVCRDRLDRAQALELIRRAHAAGGWDRLETLTCALAPSRAPSPPSSYALPFAACSSQHTSQKPTRGMHPPAGIDLICCGLPRLSRPSARAAPVASRSGLSGGRLWRCTCSQTRDGSGSATTGLRSR
jgi:hypothetical protein